MSAAVAAGRHRVGWSWGPLGGTIRPRYLWILLLVGAIAAGILVFSITVGTLSFPLERTIPAVFGVGDRVEVVVVSKRTVRVVAGLLVGFLLGAAGALTQSLMRNPLASPDILGVTAGAGMFAVFAIVTPVAGVSALVLVPVAALVGGLVATTVVVLLAWRRGLDPFRLVLVGIAITAIGGAVTQWLLMTTENDWAAVAMRWLAGSLSGVTATEVAFLSVVALIGTLFLIVSSRALAALRFGVDQARSLGVRTGPAQIWIIVLAVALVSCATAAAGPIGFVAFVAPQIAMRLFGTAGPPPFASGLTGAAMVSAADLLARWLPVDLPVGIITCIVGGPVLLVLLYRYVRSTSA